MSTLSLMAITLLALDGAGAPWPVEISGSLTPAPTEIQLYAVVQGDPLVSMTTLQEHFGIQGDAEWLEDLEGMEYLAEGGKHLAVFDGGGATYRDLSALAQLQAMEPLDEGWMWDTAESVLDSLGLLGGVPLQRDDIGTAERSEYNLDGQLIHTDLLLQSASFRQVIDGLPTFDAGSQTKVIFGPGGAVVALSHNQRRLVPAGTVHPVSQEEAILRYLERAGSENHWNRYRIYVKDVERVEIEDVVLGYMIPPGSVHCDRYQPAYRITGTAHGYDAYGEPYAAPLLWWEPALDGDAVPETSSEAPPF